MVKETESLAEFVRRVRTEKRLSLVDVARQSGGRISDGHISRIENGYILNITPKKLSALARGLQEPEDFVFAKARGLSLETPGAIEMKLLVKFRALPPERQSDMMKILDALFREHAQPAEQSKTSSKKVSRIRDAA